MADVPGTGSCTVFVILFPVAFFMTIDGSCPVHYSCMRILYGLSTYVVYIVLNISLSERYLWYLITNFELRTPRAEYVHIYRVLPSRSSSLAAQVNYGALKRPCEARAVERRWHAARRGNCLRFTVQLEP
jgi:hypothetical protein